MKKLVSILAVLLIATPVMAAVTIECNQPTEGEGIVEIRYQVDDTDLVRAFALDIVLDNGADFVGEPNEDYLDPNYWVYPGQIVISGGAVVDTNTPVASGNGALTGTGQMTIEMASLYYGDNNEPDPNGLLCTIEVDGDCTVSISGNATRGNVVFESGVSVEVSASCQVTGMDPTAGTCWDITECGCQPNGDINCDGSVDFVDLFGLKSAWGSNPNSGNWNCCADFDHSKSIDFVDLFAIKSGWGTTGCTPAENETSCPTTYP
jgi:hypothetical protein